MGLLLLTLAILMALPQLVPLLFPAAKANVFILYRFLDVLLLANIWAVLAMSWDFLGGYAGQISFGHSFFFGLGGYTSAVASLLLHWPAWVVVAMGGIIAAVGGLIVAAPALRLRGPYLSLITLAAALGLDRLMRIIKWEIGIPGAEGAILCTPACLISYQPMEKYYYALALMVLSFLVLSSLARSRIGLALEAIRDDEEAAQAAGINTAKYKTLAFAISGFFAGISGAFYVYHIGSASPSSLLNLERSIEAIIASVIGGMGTVIGPVFGAYFFIVTQEYLRPLQNWRFFVLFLLALLVLFFVPRGVLTEIRVRLRQRLPALHGGKRRAHNV
jgi:branched-chain amino acid transport system permease protein